MYQKNEFSCTKYIYIYIYPDTNKLKYIIIHMMYSGIYICM